VGKYWARVSNAVRSVKSHHVRLELALTDDGNAPVRTANKFLDGFQGALGNN
jgi:hypothetical protein